MKNLNLDPLDACLLKTEKYSLSILAIHTARISYIGSVTGELKSDIVAKPYSDFPLSFTHEHLYGHNKKYIQERKNLGGYRRM